MGNDQQKKFSVKKVYYFALVVESDKKMIFDDVLEDYVNGKLPPDEFLQWIEVISFNRQFEWNSLWKNSTYNFQNTYVVLSSRF